MTSPIPRWQANLILLATTAVWGSSFVVVKEAVEAIDPYLFIALRFAVAGLLLGGIFGRRLLSSGPETWKAGAWMGLWLFLGFTFQTLGLALTSSTNSGFITGLCVVMVPLGSALLRLKWPDRSTSLGVLLAAAGLVLLSTPDNLAPNRGDLLTLIAAVAFAIHILATGNYAPKHHPGVLALIQILTVGLISSLAAAASGSLSFVSLSAATAPVWMAVIAMGIVATAGGYLAQTAVQRFTTPTSTALIFLMEPVFAAIFAFVFRGEVIGPQGWVGAGLILAGMAISELRSPVAPESLASEQKLI